jgi:hypothetical protein
MTRLLALLLLGWCLLAAAASPSPQGNLIIERADGGRVELTVEVAATDEQRRVGLMGRESLAPAHGMLFDFLGPTVATMWMKDTRLSLDMLFLDEQGRVVWMVERTTPGSLALITTPQLVRYVLELQAGEAHALGLATGDRAALPVPADAASGESR